jgi:hypothetical protein
VTWGLHFAHLERKLGCLFASAHRAAAAAQRAPAGPACARRQPGRRGATRARRPPSRAAWGACARPRRPAARAGRGGARACHTEYRPNRPQRPPGARYGLALGAAPSSRSAIEASCAAAAAALAVAAPAAASFSASLPRRTRAARQGEAMDLAAPVQRALGMRSIIIIAARRLCLRAHPRQTAECPLARPPCAAHRGKQACPGPGGSGGVRMRAPPSRATRLRTCPAAGTARSRCLTGASRGAAAAQAACPQTAARARSWAAGCGGPRALPLSQTLSQGAPLVRARLQVPRVARAQHAMRVVVRPR